MRQSAELRVKTPAWAAPLCGPSRYKGAHGGRGSGKSHFFAEELILCHVENPATSSVCLREIQKSIKFSVKLLLESKIRDLGVERYFEIQDTVIKRRGGRGMIVFQGMQNHTADSIKSLEGFDRAWFEEAQNASQRSLDLLRPTIRRPLSELWFSWNPNRETDPIDALLRGPKPPPDSVVVQVNYEDNPWFPDVLREEMEYDKRRDPDKYLHIWRGDYEKNSEARVFKNWRIEEFDSDPGAMLLYGADWGFASDPTVLIRGYIEGRTLFVDYEAYQLGCDIIDTPALFATVPESERWPITADSSRPETISHMKQNGYPKILPAVKGSGSIKDGIEFLNSHDIVVHPRCRHTIDELAAYSYKVDRLTGAVLPELSDADNHVIDALRYACEGRRRAEVSQKKVVARPLPSISRW